LGLNIFEGLIPHHRSFIELIFNNMSQSALSADKRALYIERIYISLVIEVLKLGNLRGLKGLGK
jgi:hypothetical protein